MTVASNHSEQYLAAVLISCWNIIFWVIMAHFWFSCWNIIFWVIMAHFWFSSGSQTMLQTKMSLGV